MKADVQTALVGLIGLVIGGLIGAWATYYASQREAEVKMIEIAVGILSVEPKESIKPARRWAVDVLDFYSRDVPLTDEVKKALRDNALPVRTFYQRIGSGAIGDGPMGGGPFGPWPQD